MMKRAKRTRAPRAPVPPCPCGGLVGDLEEKIDGIDLDVVNALDPRLTEIEDGVARVAQRLEQVVAALSLDLDPDAMRRLRDDEKGPRSTRTPGGVQQVTWVTEPGRLLAKKGDRDA